MKRLFQDVLTEYKSFGDLFALAFMVGICIFFWGWNPPVTVLIFLILLTGLLSISKRAYLFKPIGILLFSFFCGIMVAALRFETVNSPILDHPISQAEVIGTVHQISESPDGQTLILSDVRLPNHIFISLPKNVQLKHKSVFPRFQIGDVIHVRANLRPPRLPSAPGFYNEARTLYFRQVGATGYIDTVLSIRYGGISPNRIIENIRLHIRNRIRQILPSGPADIAIPLTIGDQNSVSPKLYDLFRTAGIVHILSVSGFHLSLLAIWAFFLCRGILSFFPTLSACLSAKKISATVALIIVGGYVLISGMQIPAIRSFIMLGIMIGAIFVNRSSLSFRSLSVAALLILLFRPEYVFHIGFQLSFTAVLILISLYHSFEGHFLVPLKSTRIKWLIRPIIGLAIASAFITLATLPLTAYHFNQIAPYSILGNVLTGIILSFWIMPCLFLGLCLMPLGGDALFLKAGGMGLSYIITVCEKIQTLPGALIRVPAIDMFPVILMMAGIIILCVFKTKLRLIGLGVILTGLILAGYTPKPDIFISDNGQTVAIRREDGTLRFLSIYPYSNTASLWLQKNGEDPHPPHISNPFPPFIYIKQKKIALTEDGCFRAHLCLNHLQKDQTYLIYISDKIKIKTP